MIGRRLAVVIFGLCVLGTKSKAITITATTTDKVVQSASFLGNGSDVKVTLSNTPGQLSGSTSVSPPIFFTRSNLIDPGATAGTTWPDWNQGMSSDIRGAGNVVVPDGGSTLALLGTSLCSICLFARWRQDNRL